MKIANDNPKLSFLRKQESRFFIFANEGKRKNPGSFT